MNERFNSVGLDTPPNVTSTLQLLKIPEANQQLMQRLWRAGPSSTSSPETAEEHLRSLDIDQLNEAEVASALLFIAFNINASQYDPANLVAAVRTHPIGKSIDWGVVVQHFDQPGIQITPTQFAVLFNALLPITRDIPDFDIQSLYTGQWEHTETLISFLSAFLTASNLIDVQQIPNLRRGYDLALFSGAHEEILEQAKEAVRSSFVSQDAVAAVFEHVLPISETSAHFLDGQKLLRSISEHHLATFLICALSLPKPRADLAKSHVSRAFMLFFIKQNEAYHFALEGAWRQDRDWTMGQLFQAFSADPLMTELILEHAEEHGWTQYILQPVTPLSLDLACLCHKLGRGNIEDWIRNAASHPQTDIGAFLQKYIRVKADDEIRVQKKEQQSPLSVSLGIKTVFTLLEILSDYVNDDQALIAHQRVCLTAYPRLANYDQGVDEVIEANGREGNALPEPVESEMHRLFLQMLSSQISIRELLELMRQYKTSQDAIEQDYFASIVRILFEEYNAFDEYPPEALMKTACLFGSIINFSLIGGIPLRVGLGMILEAVRESSPGGTFYKFGIEATEQLTSRLPEWVLWCRQLVEIPGLRNTRVYKVAEEILKENGQDLETEAEASGPNGAADSFTMTNGNLDELLDAETSSRRFQSLHVDPPPRGRFKDPEESDSDAASFQLNNLSESNLNDKLAILQSVLRDEYFQWFAHYLVEQRARLEPNNQPLYLTLLGKFDNQALWNEVLRETYVSSIRMLNAESTANSTTERAHLKNLGAWLGSLTLAKNKPIKHKNIYFKGLLIEGYESQRLVVVIPFTCKVLIQVAKSKVFMPPNPWLMEIMRLLMELYHYGELKLNLKFEIEVLCKDLKLDYKSIDPASEIRSHQPSQQLEETISAHGLSDGLDGFDDLTLPGISRAVPSERVDANALMTTLPPLDQVLMFPPISNNMVDHNHVQQVVINAFRRAIFDIIAPVVDRSIAIASMSTAALVSKDYACEGDEEKVRSAARVMVKSLAGSLALVTCKEPLKMSITNYMRRPNEETPELPEGAILMCVNDNLDWACSYIEGVAEDKSLAEVDNRIEEELEKRRRHKASRPSEPYVEPTMNRYSQYIPEPYRHNVGGLNEQQLAVYANFARQERGVSANHVQNVSNDSSSRQLPDVLSEPFSTMPSLTPAEQPALPHQTPQMPPEPRLMPSALTPQTQVNGFLDNANPQEKVQILVGQIQRSARESSVEHVKDLPRENPIYSDFNQVVQLLSTSRSGESLARLLAQKIGNALFDELQSQLEVEVMAHLLAKVCQLSEFVSRDVYRWLLSQEDSHIFKQSVTLALVDAGLIEFSRIDAVLTKALQAKKQEALKLLHELVNRYLFVDEPIALRADFSGSLFAANHWLAEDSDVPFVGEIDEKLKTSLPSALFDTALDDKSRARHDQMEYLFDEWVGLYQNAALEDRPQAAFAREMQLKQILSSQEDSAAFFRLCVDNCVNAFELEARSPDGNSINAFSHTDALAKLVIMIIKLQDGPNGTVQPGREVYLKAILAIIVLVLNHHHVLGGERFNERVFFRLFSSILSEYSANNLQQLPEHRAMMFAFADIFEVLQPLHVPGFAYGWFGLVSHRLFMPNLLNMPDVSGWSRYSRLLELMLQFVGEHMKSPQFSPVAQELYVGALRVLLLLHHDYPAFIAENHFQLCNAIPAHCAQFRNLVLSAFPQSMQDLPDPFAGGLKADRLEEMRRDPVIAVDAGLFLRRANIMDPVTQCLHGAGPADSDIARICSAVNDPNVKESGYMHKPINVDMELLHALALFIGQDAILTGSRPEHGPKDTRIFKSESSHTALIDCLVKAFHPEARLYFFHAMTNQLRYPNTHTNYFIQALLHIFGTERADQQDSGIRQQIVQVILERMVADRPHPWGLLILLLELDQNRAYNFWDLGFLAAAPEVNINSSHCRIRADMWT